MDSSSSNVSNNMTISNTSSPSLIPNTYEIHRIAAPELLVVDRLITPIWYFIGIIGNIISAKIWLSKKVRKTNSSAIYLGSIAIVHIVFIFLHVWMELLQAWGWRTYNRPYLCEIYMVFLITPQYLAPILILGFTVERYIAVCHPFMKEKYCTVKRAATVVSSLTMVAVIFALCQGYVWTYDDKTFVCEIRPEATEFYILWTWFSEMLVFLIVPVTVLVFNIMVIVEIRRINKFGTTMGQEGGRGSNQTSTITLLSVSFYLICTLLPATIVYTIQLSIPTGDLNTPPEHWASDPTWKSYLIYYHIRRIIEEICFSNYSCYVFIYYITSSYFQDETKRMLGVEKCAKKLAAKADSSSYAVVDTCGKTSIDRTQPQL